GFKSATGERAEELFAFATNLIALVLLIISGISDVAKLPGKGTPALLEDGTKMLAILNVCIYYWGICEQTLFRVMYPKSEHRLSTGKKA
ncbi:MAG: hypothetical protein AAFY67_11180, partial [Cyanobacteria bacterium J06642_9]